MIGDLRLEILRRIMTALIKISKGNTYLEKLESSYKTNMIAFFFVLVALVGIFVKYVELDYYAKDAEEAYTEMISTIKESNNLLSTLRISNDDKTEMIRRQKLHIERLQTRIKELEEEQALKDNNKKVN